MGLTEDATLNGLKEKEQETIKADRSRLEQIKADRAEAAQAKVRKRAEAAAKALAACSLDGLPAEAKKLEKDLTPDGALTAAAYAVIGKAGKTPDGKELLKEFRLGVKPLGKIVDGDSKRQMVLLNAIQSWFADAPERIDSVGGYVGKLVHALYDADVCEEDECIAWFKGLKDAAEKATAAAEKSGAELMALVDGRDSTSDKLALAEKAEKEAQATCKETAARATNAKCRGNPSPVEEAREKEANQADRAAQKDLADKTKFKETLKKKKQEAVLEIDRMMPDDTALQKKAGALNGIVKNSAAFFTWLEEAEEDSD